MTSCTPSKPRALNERRNAVQNAPSSESPTSKPRTSQRPSAVTPVAITTAWDTTRGQLGVDQSLVDRLRRCADPVLDPSGLHGFKHLE